MKPVGTLCPLLQPSPIVDRFSVARRSVSLRLPLLLPLLLIGLLSLSGCSSTILTSDGSGLWKFDGPLPCIECPPSYNGPEPEALRTFLPDSSPSSVPIQPQILPWAESTSTWEDITFPWMNGLPSAELPPSMNYPQLGIVLRG